MTDKTEIELLKEQADNLGVPYSPNIGIDTLRERIAEAGQKSKPVEVKEDLNFKTNPQYRQHLIKEANKLERVIITNRNPNKKDTNHEYFTVSNSAIGTITRLVPFNIETHVESALLKVMPDRKFAKVTMKKNSEGIPYPDRKVIAEIGIERLPALTKQELSDLAADQAKRGAIDK